MVVFCRLMLILYVLGISACGDLAIIVSGTSSGQKTELKRPRLDENGHFVLGLSGETGSSSQELYYIAVSDLPPELADTEFDIDSDAPLLSSFFKTPVTLGSLANAEKIGDLKDATEFVYEKDVDASATHIFFLQKNSS